MLKMMNDIDLQIKMYKNSVNQSQLMEIKEILMAVISMIYY